MISIFLIGSMVVRNICWTLSVSLTDGSTDTNSITFFIFQSKICMGVRIYGYSYKLFVERLGASMLNDKKKTQTNYFLFYQCD